MPIAHCYAPDLVLVSAGFDAARSDPLGGCDVTPAGYAHMTSRLLTLARGRVVVALEGGYNLRAISTSADAVLRVLLGAPPPPLFEPPPRTHARPSAAARELRLDAAQAELFDGARVAAAAVGASEGTSADGEFAGMSRATILRMFSPAPVGEAAIEETARHLAPFWPCVSALAALKPSRFIFDVGYRGARAGDDAVGGASDGGEERDDDDGGDDGGGGGAGDDDDDDGGTDGGEEEDEDGDDGGGGILSGIIQRGAGQRTAVGGADGSASDADDSSAAAPAQNAAKRLRMN
jgi:hypothetical protein